MKETFHRKLSTYKLYVLYSYYCFAINWQRSIFFVVSIPLVHFIKTFYKNKIKFASTLMMEKRANIEKHWSILAWKSVKSQKTIQESQKSDLTKWPNTKWAQKPSLFPEVNKLLYVNAKQIFISHFIFRCETSLWTTRKIAKK